MTWRDKVFLFVILPAIGLAAFLAAIWPWMAVVVIGLCFLLERFTR